MFYGRALYFISVCWAQAPCRAALRAHHDFFAPSPSCRYLRVHCRPGACGSPGSTNAGLFQPHVLQERGSSGSTSSGHFGLVAGTRARTGSAEPRSCSPGNKKSFL